MRARLAAAVLAMVMGMSVAAPAVVAQDLPNHATGIELVGLEVSQARPKSDAQAAAFDAAFRLAMAHPEDLGYPWIDPTTDTLELSAATAAGREILSRRLPDPVPTRVRNTPRSWADLRRLETALISARNQLNHGALIWKLEPDERLNRIIVTISALDDDLLADLAAQFGPEAIAVRVDPAAPQAGTNRQSDFSPFKGGARISVPEGVCSTAFGWRNGSLWEGMLTAGHCAPTGGSVSSGSGQSMGNITATTRENWDVGFGTQSWPGEPGVYRGDIGLVTLAPGRAAGTRIYRGNASSVASSPLLLTWQRWSRPGDDVCTGAATTGEKCGWDVRTVGVTMWYAFDGPFVFSRNVVEAKIFNFCIAGGDSGGSVFTLYQTGVAAKGIISGSANEGPIGCFLYYTDIQNAVQTLPGGVKTQ